MLQLTEAEVELIDLLLPPDPDNPKGGRPRSNRRKAIEGILWVLDNRAKWKDLPEEFGSKSSVHRAFQRWVEAGAFEKMLRDMGELVLEEKGFKLFECYVDDTFARAKGGGEGIGSTKARQGGASRS